MSDKVHQEMLRENELGRVAYEAYCQSVGGKSPITGDTLPPFEVLTFQVSVAWIAAARAVAGQVRNERHG